MLLIFPPNADSTLQIMAPGQLPSNHVHDVWGGNGFTSPWDYTTATGSSCNTMGPKDDHSNYWFPALYHHSTDGQYRKIASRMSAYYRFETSPNGPRKMFPPGFKIVTGNPFLRADESATNPASKAITWTCHGAAGGDKKKVAGFPADVTDCPGANGLTAEIWLPFCWDGIDAFDIADPSKHVKYGDAQVGGYGGTCPSSHPTPLPQILLEVHYDISPFAQGQGQSANADLNPQEGNSQLQSSPLLPRQSPSGERWVLSPGDPTGYGFHADFVNGWAPGSLERAIAPGDADNVTERTNCYMPDTGEADNAISRCFEMLDPGVMAGCKVARVTKEEVEGPMGELLVGSGGGLATRDGLNAERKVDRRKRRRFGRAHRSRKG